MDRSCYIILLVLILLCRGYTTHHAKFGIEGYHAIIKIARDHLLPYIYLLINITITYGHRTFV